MKKCLPRAREGKKRKAAPSGEVGTPKKGKASLPDHSTTAAFSDEECLPRGKAPGEVVSIRIP